MKRFQNWTVLLAISVFSAVAADRVVVYRAQLAGPMGTDAGKVTMVGDQLVFVDDSNPDMSFTIPRADIRSLRMDNGTLTMGLARPFVNAYGQRSDVMLRLTDPAASSMVASWVGLPLSGGAVGEPDRFASMPPEDLMFNVRHDDDTGRMVVGANGLDFEALSNAKKSRRWSYNQIKELKRDPDDRKVKLETYNGEKFEFKLEGRGMTDAVYNLIADRIIAARRP